MRQATRVKLWGVKACLTRFQGFAPVLSDGHRDTTPSPVLRPPSSEVTAGRPPSGEQPPERSSRWLDEDPPHFPSEPPVAGEEASEPRRKLLYGPRGSAFTMQ